MLLKETIHFKLKESDIDNNFYRNHKQPRFVNLYSEIKVKIIIGITFLMQ